ncbi:MAG TPA: YafY family protein, partial [Phototrophicaceae bacterium]|nr:YafY family protein [Phototrophicaceae bacterium]
MRADRLLSIVLLLQTHPRMTANELSERLEVSLRTIQRDMEALSGAGVPVVASRGTGGGWSLLEPFQTSLTGLNTGEILALFLNRPPQVLEDLGVYQAYKAALLKLLAAIPEIARPYAEWIQASYYIDTSGWTGAGEDISFLPCFEEAICEKRRVKITLRSSEEGMIDTLVSPLGLVARGESWYLVAASEETVQAYRIAQILDVQLTTEPFICPSDFNLGHWWDQHVNEIVSVPDLLNYRVLMRVAPDAILQITGKSAEVCVETIEDPDVEGWRTVQMLLIDEEAACHYILSFGTQIQILEPFTLRDQVIKLAQAV